MYYSSSALKLFLLCKSDALIGRASDLGVEETSRLVRSVLAPEGYLIPSETSIILIEH